MSRSSQLQKENWTRRNADVRKRYDDLISKRDTNTKVRVHTHEYCLAQVAYEFYLMPNTVQHIINGHGKYGAE